MVKWIVSLIATLVIIVAGWSVWKLRPFTPAGQKIFVGTWKFDDCEIQIWQTKNSTIGEAFSTSLYVRHQTNNWYQYYLNHQDYHAPHYSLFKSNEIVVVRRSNLTLGSVYLVSGQYERIGGGISFEAEFTHSPP